MIVVSDASPLNVLIRLNCVDLLAELFGGVLIPTAVEAELTHPRTPVDVREWMLNRPGWLAVRAPSRPFEALNLGPGEAEAIALALESGNGAATISEYKRTIHDAVCVSGGKDAYTGEQLDWSLLSQYDNRKSKHGRREYKSRFGLLPTVDHVGDGMGSADFKICAWRTNDAKGDLPYDEFVALCRRVVAASKRARS